MISIDWRKSALLGFFILSATLLGVSPGLADDEEKEDWYKVRLFGYVEPIVLVEGNIQMQARLDTGAETTSLHATDIETFEKDDEEWVRFTTEGDDGKNAEYEREVLHTVKIVGEENSRPVIMMDVCLGNLQKTVEVNLNDRSELTYSALIGRNFMQPGILVNGSEKNTSTPDCDLAVPE
ncbi:ATP-dependent zinc protease family protein [Fodinicurvata sediminis]|uniref:ATP-dependent zinc protease family protein n=1 Tax=Fodinicurvata sediminis TaxID=1121832 RepID=UPI0003B54010|nr:RimK/LysX family protein [Fodinicurvata sediminis]